MTIAKIKEAVREIAPLYPVISIDLFGSYAANKASDSSDVDLLVYFDDDKASLLDMSGLQLDLQDKLNIKVDIVAGPLKNDSYLIINKRVRIYG